MTMSRSAR